ncbi:hypothetical protein [Streptomyces regalis]|uniref:Uncharacterized protein n=1 Tax=Streptomyces regalis TaxID=68262 RepID=A0A117MKK4_9ACTN|nr:hypothetical protein [Streptomyces regalis]KUL22509.1 hypothetical protein ADL12_42300 [Streptomyces regalis]
MRRMRVAAVCGAAVLATVGGVAPGAAAAGPPEAGLAYHGSADMSAGRVDVRFTPHNHGPSAVPESTVRLRWSEPLADRQVLPEGCASAEERVVTCRVGALDAGGVGERIALRVRLRGAPEEVSLEFDTVPSGGAADGARGTGQQRVLVLDTGDTYYF